MIAKISLSSLFPFRFFWLNFILSSISLCVCWPSVLGEGPKPNVLFIAIDDLNDWVGCMGGHPQALTPNLDRLAASGVLFENAHCPAPACNPSRTAIFTGISPHVSGLYRNEQKMREDAWGRTVAQNLFQSGILVRWFG